MKRKIEIINQSALILFFASVICFLITIYYFHFSLSGFLVLAIYLFASGFSFLASVSDYEIEYMTRSVLDYYIRMLWLALIFFFTASVLFFLFIGGVI